MENVYSRLLTFTKVHVTETNAEFSSILEIVQTSANLDDPAIV